MAKPVDPVSGFERECGSGAGQGHLRLGGRDKPRVDVGAPLQRRVDRANVGDLEQPLALLVAELARKGDLPFDAVKHRRLGREGRAVLRVHAIVSVNRDAREGSSFASGIHAKGDRGAGAERHQEQSIRVRAQPRAANGSQLIGHETVRSGRDEARVGPRINVGHTYSAAYDVLRCDP
jgi:hypothetical protein